MTIARVWIPTLCLILGACAQTPHQISNDAIDESSSSGYQDYWQDISPDELPSVAPAPGGITALAGTTPSAVIKASISSSSDTLWARMATQLTIADIKHERIDHYVAEFRRMPRHVSEVTERAKPFLHYIVEETERRGMPVELAMIPMIESGYQPRAVSPGKAAGLWQIRPATGRHLGLQLNSWYDGRHDVRASTHAALDYLEFLHEKFDGDWLLAMAGYNAGWGNVQKAIRRNQQQGRPTDFWSLPLPRITRAYIPKVLALSRILADPNSYGLSVPEIRNEPFLVEVEVTPSMDLSMAAAKAGMSEDSLRDLNPGFKRGTVPPTEKPWQLLLPTEEALALRATLENLQTEPTLLADSDLDPKFADTPGDPQGTLLVDTASDSLLDATDNPDHQPQLSTPRDLRGELAASRAQESLPGDTTPLEYRYTVKAGDTLSTIAQRYGLSTVELARDNRRNIDGTLKVGETLVVSTAEETIPEELRSDDPDADLNIVNYLVQEGDSLWNISERFQVSVAELRRWNDIPDWLQQPDPGKIIVVYLDVEPTRG